jgi:hypothetical protein
MQSADDVLLTRQAQVFTRYLIGEEADELSIRLYIQAHKKLPITLSAKEEKRLNFLIGNPTFIGMADGALALTNQESGIRKKLYVLFSILESSPAFAKHFLPKTNNTPILSIIGSGIRALWNALTGMILLVWI